MGLEAVTVSSSHDVDDSPRTGGVDSGTVASVSAGMDAVDRISPVSGFALGVTTSWNIVPSGGQDNVAARGVS